MCSLGTRVSQTHLLYILGKWELDRNDLEIMDILGSGCFGVSLFMLLLTCI